ncbi:MAG: DUF1508 domain-containing protein [Lewinella sp.]|nr:DUF1508 domain-containing protein [Lewinella sp.]
MTGKYDLKKSPSGKFRFNLRASNGQIMLTSELYNTRKSVVNGITSIKKNVAMTRVLSAKPPSRKCPFLCSRLPMAR